LSNPTNQPHIVKPSSEEREKISKAVVRVMETLRAETSDPQEQIKILLNVFGLRVARSQFDNPVDLERLVQGLPAYVVAYRTDSGDYGDLTR
jgi:hypothetical protein